ncbi:MAG: M4 family metallopeptidase [Candidatus Azotimanducaceae bacterium]
MLSNFLRKQNTLILIGVGTGLVLLAALGVYSIFFAPHEDGFRLNKVTDETRELFSRKNTNTKTLSEEALAARADFFSEKAGNPSSEDPNKLSTEQLESAMNQLLAATQEPKKPARKRLDPVEMASLKALDLSGQTPRVRRSSEGKLLSVSGNFDLTSFSSNGNASPTENAVSNFLASHPKTFGLNESVSLKFVSAPKEGVSGDQIIRLEKSLDGLPIWGEHLVVSVLGNEARVITGALRDSPRELDTNAILTDNEIQRITQEHLNGDSDSFKISGYERGVVRYADRFSYAYRVNVNVSPSEGWELYITPFGKRVLLKVPTVFTQLTPSSGIDLLGEEVNFNSTKSSDGNFIMLDDSFPSSSQTQIAANIFDEDGERVYGYVSSSDPNSGWNAAGVSAMKNTKLIYDYFLSKHNRDSFDDKGSPLVSIVDYQSTEGECFNNAYWNGSQMTYGDGCFETDGLFKNFAGSLDVAAHEVAHGVVQFTSNLRYENQSGALNESYADIFGVSVEHMASANSSNWLIGDTIMRPGLFMRDFRNPASGISPQPAHMDDYRFLPIDKDNGGVHANSGIQNRAFYLLVEGNQSEGIGTSIGRNDAETIIYAALLKLTPSSEYIDSANQWAIEAELIFGANSRQVTAVQQAWANVGIDIGVAEETDSTDENEETDDGTSDDSPAENEEPDDGTSDDSPAESENKRDIPLPQGDDVVVYLVAQDGSTGSGDDPSNEQYDLMFYNAAQETDGFVAEANLGPFNDFPAAYIRPAVATLPGSTGQAALFYVRDDTRKLYVTYSDQLEEEDIILDFGEDITIKSVAASRDGSRIAVVIEQAQFVIYVIDLVKEEVSSHEIREPNYIPDDPGTAVDLVDSISFDPQGTSLIFDYRVCREEIGSEICTELWSVGLVKVSSGSVEFPFLDFQDPLIDIANPRYSQKTYEAIVLDIVDFSNYEAEEKAATAVAILTSEGTTGVINPNQSENFDRAYGYPSFVGDDEAVLVQARFDDSIFLYSVAIDENYEAENSATNVIPFSAALSAAHVNVFVNTRTVLGLKEENIELGSVDQGKQLSGSFTLGNFSNSDISITNVTPSSDEISTELGNTRLLPGEQKAFSFSVKTNNLSGGDYSGSISIEHDADNPPIEVKFSASIEGTNVLEAPKNLVATDGTNSEAILLSWNSVQGAQEYRVYWADEPESRKKRLVTVSTAPSSSNALRHEAGNTNTYYYWVTALGAESESALSDVDTGFIGEGGTSSGDTGNSSDGNDGSSESKITFGGKEYRWIKERKTQTAAQAHAENLGGHLAVINSAAEDDFVYSIVRDASLSGLGTASDGGGVSYVWLGGNDASSEDTWVWVNGDAFSYTNWGRAEPDNYLNQDGLAMGLENWPAGRSGSSAFGLAGEWNDIDRGNELTFIVELPLESSDNKGEDGSDSGSGDNGSDDQSDTGSGTSSDATPDFESSYSVSLGPFGGCAIDDSGLNCWGTSWISNSSRFPILSNPRQVTAGRVHACVLDVSGVSCWGFNEDGQTNVPSLSNPYFIVAEQDTTCALDDDGVKCWGKNSGGQAGITDVPRLVNPREIAISFYSACALDDTGIVCWGDDSRALTTTIPNTVNPSNLTLGDLHGCVIDNGRPICWANGFNEDNVSNSSTFNQPELVNPRELVSGGYHVCTIDDQDLKCWGQNRKNQLELPQITNPSKLYAAGQYGMCVLDDNGLQCWGGR